MLLCVSHGAQDVVTDTAWQKHAVRMNGFAGIDPVFAWLARVRI